MNTRRTILLGISACFIASFCPSEASAQRTKGGGISTEMLQIIEKGQMKSAGDYALANAIAQNSIDNLAKNFRHSGPVDTYFSVQTPKQNIHDQKSSGRCWLFSVLTFCVPTLRASIRTLCV